MLPLNKAGFVEEATPECTHRHSPCHGKLQLTAQLHYLGAFGESKETIKKTSVAETSTTMLACSLKFKETEPKRDGKLSRIEYVKRRLKK
jgi:hypothetical protein